MLAMYSLHIMANTANIPGAFFNKHPTQFDAILSIFKALSAGNVRREVLDISEETLN